MKKIMKATVYTLAALYMGVCISLIFAVDVNFEEGRSLLPWWNILGIAMLAVVVFGYNVVHEK